MWPVPRTENESTFLKFSLLNPKSQSTSQEGEPAPGVDGLEAAHLAPKFPRFFWLRQPKAKAGAEPLAQHEVAHRVRVPVVEQGTQAWGTLEDVLEDGCRVIWDCVANYWKE